MQGLGNKSSELEPSLDSPSSPYTATYEWNDKYPTVRPVVKP